MAHHAFMAQGSAESVVQRARGYAARSLALSDQNNPDISEYRYGLFSVEDVRKIIDGAYASAVGNQKLIILYAGRLFHEAQNALLKIIEEPPQGVTIVIGVPTFGMLLPTLRSRLLPLPEEVGTDAGSSNTAYGDTASVFMALSAGEREKYVSKLLDRTKSDKDEVKQGARAEAAELLSGITKLVHTQHILQKEGPKREELRQVLEDLSAFAPLLHERSTPLKLIFEHLLLTIPQNPQTARV